MEPIVLALSKIDAWGADGLRQRYTVTGGGSETFYLYDPQGTVVSRIVSSDPAVHNDGEVFTDLCVFDGYGQQRSDQWTGRTVDQQYSPDDPVGFEGQAGYYQDWEIAKSSNPAQYVYLITTPSLLTRRYYDASTGRFVNRDPIDYQGGENLYGYCGGNPVNETDPDGTSYGDYLLGIGDGLNPINIGKGLVALGGYLGSGHASASALGHAFIQGINPTDPYINDRQMGQRAFALMSIVVTAGRSGLGVANGLKAAGSAGVWASIAGESTEPGAFFRKPFVMTAESGSKYYVLPSALKHIDQDTAALLKPGNAPSTGGMGFLPSTPAIADLAIQARLTSLRAAISLFEKQGITYNQMVKVGGWELGVDRPKTPGPGMLPVIYHALPKE